jgi:tetratricopeptide (TPR) repeat protein
VTSLVSASAMPTTHAASEVTHSAAELAELAALLPPGWSLDFPLARVRTCGALTVEVVLDLQPGPDGRWQAVYGPPAAELFHIKGMTTALLLLALLASQRGGFASKDLLAQTLPHLRRGKVLDEEDDLEEDGSLARLDNVVSLLRKLLCPPRLLTSPGMHRLRKRLVTLVRATPESGPGYRLAAFPLLWLDVEAMEQYSARARKLEDQGEDGLEEWQAAYQIGMRGSFLSHEPYSEWADWRRARVNELLWQSVNAQCKRAVSWGEGTGRIQAAVRLLLEYWQAHVTNEDAFRALLDLLGKQERFQLAEECYRQLCAALDQAGRLPHPRTQEAMDALRRVQLRRASQQQGPTPASSSPEVRVAEGGVADPNEGTLKEGRHEAAAERIIPEIRHLIGREVWLASVCQMVQAFPAKKLIVLQGPIGIGKSSELTRLASYLQRADPASHVIWLPLAAPEGRGGPEAALDVLLGTLLHVCGCAPVPSEVARERLIADFLASLRRQPRSTVILLDNAECMLESNGALAPCWEAFLVQFVRSRHQATLVLATNEWHGWPGRESLFVAETVVPPLTTDESVCLLQRLGLQELALEQLQAVGVRMAGIPLLLEWTAKVVADPLLLNEWSGFDERDGLLQAHPTQASRARRLQQLLDHPSLLGMHLASRLIPLLQHIMDTHLSPEAHRVLERLAVATVPLGKPALQVLCPRPALLKELRDASLLAAYTNRVQLLPMVAETVRQQLTPEQRQEAEDLVLRAYTEWREQGIEDDQEKAAVTAELIIFDLNRLRLLPAAERLISSNISLARFGHTLRIARLVFPLLEQNQWHTALEQECGGTLLRYSLAPVAGQIITTEQCAQAYQPIYDALTQGQVRLQVSTELHIAQRLVLARRNALHFTEAQEILDQTFARHPYLEQTDPHQFASLLVKRAILLGSWSTYAKEQKEEERAQNLREQAITLYRQSITIWKFIEEQGTPGNESASRYNQAWFLNDLAYYLRQQGRFDEALIAIEQGLALKCAGYTKPGSLAAGYGEKAQILAALGRFREALHFDQLAVEQIQQEALASGNSFVQSEQWVYLAERGQLYLRLGRLQEAQILFEQASANMSEDRHAYRDLAEAGLAEIQRWRQENSNEQLDWRWSKRYRELVHYDAYQWLTPAAFSPTEWEVWSHLQEQVPETERQKQMEQITIQSRDREILAALAQGREPHFHFPFLPIEEVMHKIQELRVLGAEMSRDEPNAVVRRLYLDAIKENLLLLDLIRAAHDGDTQAYHAANQAMHPAPTPEEMERALTEVARLIALGRQRSDLLEVSEAVFQFLQRIHAPLPPAPSSEQALVSGTSNPPTKSQMISPQAVQRFFDTVMRDYGFDGWRTLIDVNTTGPYVESFMKHIVLPARDMSLKEVREMLSHEIECHVFRAAAGEKSRLALLGTGTGFYRATEEGLAEYLDRKMKEARGEVVQEFTTGSLQGVLATGLASGVVSSPVTFSQLHRFFEQFLVLQWIVLSLSKTVEGARRSAVKSARIRCLRTFRGVPDPTREGIAYTHDVLYYRGIQMVLTAVEHNPQVLTHLMVGKVGLQQLEDLAELGITDPPSHPRWLAHDPGLDRYILSFETRDEREQHSL